MLLNKILHKSGKKLTAMLLTLLLVLSYIPVVSAAAPGSIAFVPGTITLYNGLMTSLATNLTVTPVDADLDLNWVSDNATVATVDAQTGVVTAVKAGTANITATSISAPTVTATCVVNVVAGDPFGGIVSTNMPYSEGASKPPSYFDPAYCFNMNFTDGKGWVGTAANSTPAYDAWLEYDFGASNARVLTGYRMYIDPSNYNDPTWAPCYPKDWFFEATNDVGPTAVWTILDTRAGQTLNAATWNTYRFVNTTAYQRYRVHIDGNKRQSWICLTKMNFLFPVDVQATATGSASASVASATIGTPVSLTAVPNPGYELVGWNTVPSDLYIDDNNSFLMPPTDVQVTPVFQKIVYDIALDITGKQGTDALSVSPAKAVMGQNVTIDYTIANAHVNNWLIFGGVNPASLSSTVIKAAGTGSATYTVDYADAVNNTITLTAYYSHTLLTPQKIAFASVGPVRKTYGDSIFTNAASLVGTGGTGAITYVSSDTSVAVVDAATGAVNIVGEGSALITATKAEDTIFGETATSYMLNVDKKPLIVNIAAVYVPAAIPAGGTVNLVMGNPTLVGIVNKDDVRLDSANIPTSGTIDSVPNVTAPVTVNGTFALLGTRASNYVVALPANLTVDSTVVVQNTLGGTASISGTNKIGGTLTVDTTSITNIGGNLRYQWKSGSDYVGIDSNSYTIQGSDAGKTITCVVTCDYTVGSVTATLGGGVVPYNIVVTMAGEAGSDAVTVSSGTGRAGDSVSVTYTLTGGSKANNRLTFGGVKSAVLSAAVISTPVAGQTIAYTVDAADAANGVIAITADFTHSDKTLQSIMFADMGILRKTYGGRAFSNTASGGSGTGVITYASGNTNVAAVNASTGAVTIVGAGSVVITATKAADGTYEKATASYTLDVAKKVLTASIVPVYVPVAKPGAGTVNLIYLGHPGLNGVINADDVTYGNAPAFGTIPAAPSASAVVTTIGSITLAGTKAGNYTIKQPTRLMVDSTIVSLLPLGGTASIYGTGEIGATLTVLTTSVTNIAGDIHYQWKCGTDMVGTDSDQYTIQGSDAGKTITCVVTCEYAAGSVTATLTVSNLPDTITFLPNGGAGIMTPVTVNDGGSFTVPACAFTRTGYIFKGWKDQYGNIYSAGDVIQSVKEDISLRANWLPGIPDINVVNGNGQANVNFAIKSANGKGYKVYISSSEAEGTFEEYKDVNYNSMGAHIKGLENGVTYYVFIEYKDANGILRSDTVGLKPGK